MSLNDVDDLDPADTPWPARKRRFRRVDISVRGGGLNSVEYVASVYVDMKNPDASRQEILKLRDLFLALIPTKQLSAMDREHIAVAPEVFVDASGQVKAAPPGVLNALRTQEQLQDMKGTPDAPGRERKPGQQGSGSGPESKGKG